MCLGHVLGHDSLLVCVQVAGQGSELLVACTQEAPLFLETLDEMGEDAPAAQFVNIREKAGWSKDASGKSPRKTDMTAKMAALLAEAALDLEAATSVTMISGGVLLVIGNDDRALEAAKKVASRLDVTVVLEPGSGVQPPALMDVPVFTGRVTQAEGHLGQFQVTIEAFQAASASSRESLNFDGTGETGTSVCDLILDLRGGTPLFPAPEKRDGYFNPDPGTPALIGDALLQLTDMVGEFDKPQYIDYDESICAHFSAGITGCTRCIDHCPTGAITPDTVNERVSLDPYICAGCGTCASVCPTGAAKYTLPAGDGLYQRLRTVLRTYLAAGGKKAKAPQILVHDQGFGSEMIDAMARGGGGLPANMLPCALTQVTQVGLDFLLSASAYGAERVLVLVGPAQADEKAGLESEIALAEAVLDGLGYGKERFAIVDYTDPAALEDPLYGLDELAPLPHRGPEGQRGQAAAQLRRGSLRAMRPVQEHVPGKGHHPRPPAQFSGGGTLISGDQGRGAVRVHPLRQAVRHPIDHREHAQEARRPPHVPGKGWHRAVEDVRRLSDLRPGGRG